MRIFRFILIGFCLGGLMAGIALADTFTLNDGKTISGEVIEGSVNASGVQVRVGDNQYQRVPWSNFSQNDLKKFATDAKMKPFVDPFIEVTEAERIKKTQVKLNPVPRLERPAPQSFFGAMFSSSVGLFALFALYAANIYAAYEISIFRARPIGAVCGLAAVVPVIGPIIFLSMPTRIQSVDEEMVAQSAETPTFAVPGVEAAPVEGETAQSGGLHLAASQPGSSTKGLPQTQIFQRGAFTFNRRFFETRFSGFFGAVRRNAEKDLVLVVKAMRGTYTAQRISRISANEIHLDVHTSNASQEVMVPFSEIQEIQLKHQDA
ncbi:MAG TPA: hypothetical protein VFM25_12665 [Verrucomicrobiae bacterium]|nr:hypothetical protein [Verrucomicrobiae bacterium]